MKVMMLIVCYLRQGGYVFTSVGLFVCLFAGLLQKFVMDLNEIFWRGGVWHSDQSIRF